MLNHFLSQVRDQISKNLEFVIRDSNHIEKAMNYSALSESKMIRAALIFASADTHNFLKNESKVTLATSVELIHTYSLIHDDLPAMDNDDFRRGKKSNHIVFGEADAILAGDALQALAYEIIADDNNLSDESKIIEKLTVAEKSDDFQRSREIAERKKSRSPEPRYDSIFWAIAMSAFAVGLWYFINSL